MFVNQYISLDVLSTKLNLPHPYLNNLAETGQIPFLDVNGRKKFQENSVREALSMVEKRSLNIEGQVNAE